MKEENTSVRTSTADVGVPTFAKFIIGGMSGIMAQTVTHPMDVLKLRMQLSRDTLYAATLHTLNTSGIRGFYVGLSAGLLRQMVYSTTRLGIYTTLLEYGERHFHRLHYITMISFGMVAGIIGSFVSTPTDLILIRMVVDVNLPPEKRKNYRNAISGIVDVWKTEGLTKLWRGAMPTVGRAAIVNGTLLGTYTRVKIVLRDTGYFEEGVQLQFVAAMTSSIITCVVSLPVDVAKTKIQHQKLSAKAPTVFATISNIAKTDGVASLWRGFLPYYCRAGPNTIITMVCVDQLHRMYFKFFSGL